MPVFGPIRRRSAPDNVVSLVQIVTSMQDPAFNSVPRLLVFLFAAMLLLPWMANRMILYTETLFGNLDRFAR